MRKIGKDVLTLTGAKGIKMRNYELLKKIWNIIHINQARPVTKLLAIENLLRRERQNLIKDNYEDKVGN